MRRYGRRVVTGRVKRIVPFPAGERQREQSNEKDQPKSSGDFGLRTSVFGLP